MMWASQFGSTRAGIAIKAGASVIRIMGVPTVKVDPPKAIADGQCCGQPYTTEYISSKGSSVHIWLSDSFDEKCLFKIVGSLIYWKDLAILTWSRGEPAGYRTYYRLDEKKPIQNAANEQDMDQASGF